MIYKIKVIKQIHSCFSGCSSNDIWLELDLEIPFVPTKEMVIEYNKDITLVFEEIYYNFETNSFTCYTPSDKELYNLGLRVIKGTDKPVDVLKEVQRIADEYIKEGWMIQSRV